METKYVRVPFDVELAKKITNGEVEGRIVTMRGDNVRIACWNYKSMSGDYPILALVDEKSQEEVIPYSECGIYNVHGYFSEDCLDLMLKIPEYMTFKDGDVIAYDSFDTISITMADVIRNVKDVFAHYYAELRNGRLYFYEEDVEDVLSVGARLATEAEKQKLIDALKASKEPKAKECLKMLGIEEKTECEFNPFDRVLVRDGNKEKWKADLFSYKTENDVFYYMCVSDSYKECIPYNEQTAHLLGTTENYE